MLRISGISVIKMFGVNDDMKHEDVKKYAASHNNLSDLLHAVQKCT